MALQVFSRKEHISPVMQYNISSITNREQLLGIHTHKDLYEIFLCVQGSAVHLVNGQTRNIEVGMVTFVRTNDIHCYIDPINDGFQILNTLVDKDVAEAAFAYLGREAAHRKLLMPETSPTVTIPNLEYRDVKSRMEKLFFFPEFDEGTNSMMLRMFVMNVLADYFLMPRFEKSTNTPVWIQWVLNEMQRPENYVLGVKALYDISCKSPEHVCREFKKHIHKTPTQVVNEIRLEEAARQLVYSSNKVIDICENVGFENLSHFHHLFKKMYSLSPLKFKEKSTRLDVM